MRTASRALLIAPVLLLAACATLPDGPGVLVLPGTGKNFEQFRLDEAECRQYASAQIGGNTPNQVSTDNTVRNAAIGAAVGTVAGALIGGRGNAGAGAGAGLVVGTAAGAGSGQASGRGLQQRYDFAYQQCMYAKGNRVPVSGRWESGREGARTAPPAATPRAPAAPPAAYPPPPPGIQPPPPPGRTG